MAPEPPPYVVLHGGVHKTATSHIQSILQRNAGRLRKSGVRYVHHRTTRKDYTVPIQLNGYHRLGLGYRTVVTDEDAARIAADYFGAIGAGPGERILISDENLPGHSGHCVKSGMLYMRRKTLIPTFARHIPHEVREVHLAVRHYADFFASAFVEFLRSASGEQVTSEARMKKAVLSRLPSWGGLVEVIAGAFPDAALTIWRLEDFGALEDRVIAGLIGPGVDVARLDAPKRKRGRPSASHRAVTELLAQIERHGAEEALSRRVEIQERWPRGPDEPGYDPWTAAERAHLGRMYERDCAELAARERVAFLRP